MKVYISGPISGYELDERQRVFDAVESALRACGHDVFNPMRNGQPRGASTHDHMRADFRGLLDCDAIYFLEGWERSAGCKSEYLLAKDCGLMFSFEIDDLQER